MEILTYLCILNKNNLKKQLIMQTNSIYVTLGAGNSRGNLYEDNNARQGNENLQQTDEGRQTPKFRRKDQGELTEVKRNVQGDVSQGRQQSFTTSNY